MKNVETDSGSASVELVILTPLLVMLALFVVLSGRSGESLRQVQHAADQGARAASQAAISHRKSVGVDTARSDLGESGAACINEEIAVESVSFGRLHGVRVEVSCEIEHSGLSLLKLHRQRVSAQSTEIVDFYRAE